MTSTTMAVARSAFTIEGLDYHLIRASMVILFLFFGYAKWFEYDVQGLEPFMTHGPLIFWLYPVLGPDLVSWSERVDDLFAPVPGLLGQTAWGARSSRRDGSIHRHRHHHSVHPQRLGAVRGWLSGSDVQHRLPDEGSSSAR